MTQQTGNVLAVDPLWWADPALKARIVSEPGKLLGEMGINVPASLNPDICRDVLKLTSVLWVDGRLVPRSRFHIDPLDEGLLFGRGVWESTRTINSDPWLWPLHIDRLQRTAKLLDIDVAPNRLPTAAQVGEYVRTISGTDAVVRLNVSAGVLGRPGMVWMSAALRPAPRPSLTLKSSLTPVIPGHPFLLWKTFQYANRLKVGSLAGAAGYDSALMLDDAGHVLEAAHANIFIRFAEGWVTPKIESGLLLPGTVRQHLLESSPKPIREELIPKARLKDAKEVFVTNSNVGLVPVVKIDDHVYEIGTETQELIRWIEPDAPTANQVRVMNKSL